MEQTTQIYGIRAVLEAINAEKSIDKVFIQKGLKGPLFKELETAVRRNNLNISYVPVERLNRFTKHNHQGVVATISPIKIHDLEQLLEQITEQEEKPLILLLDKVSDVRNLGAIIRTAACTGVHAIILPIGGSAPISADTVKTSAGGVFQVPIAKVSHLKDAVFMLQTYGISIVAATEKATETIYNTPLNKGTAIIMGSEDAGITPSILKLVDHQAKLPILGEIGSLNVSVACGVILYETLRQRMG